MFFGGGFPAGQNNNGTQYRTYSFGGNGFRQQQRRQQGAP